MFENFPYTDMHQLNLDWIIKIAKDFLDQYTSLQQMITNGETSLTNLTNDGLAALQTKADNLEDALQEWYDTHSQDIADQLADALADLNAWYTQHSGDIAGELATALETLNTWYTTHQGYLDQTLTEKTAAFNTAADAKAATTIASIPDDYTALANNVSVLNTTINQTQAFMPSGAKKVDFVNANYGDNLFDKYSKLNINGKMLFNGSLIDVANATISHFIPIAAGDVVKKTYFSATMNPKFTFYNDKFEYLSQSAGTASGTSYYYETVPVGAAFVRVNMYTVEVDTTVVTVAAWADANKHFVIDATLNETFGLNNKQLMIAKTKVADIKASDLVTYETDGVNLFSQYSRENVYGVIVYTNGEYVNVGNGLASHYMEITGSSVVKCSYYTSVMNPRFAFYDTGYNWIENQTGAAASGNAYFYATAPANAKYVRVNMYQADIGGMVVTTGAFPSTYAPYVSNAKLVEAVGLNSNQRDEVSDMIGAMPMYYVEDSGKYYVRSEFNDTYDYVTVFTVANSSNKNVNFTKACFIPKDTARGNTVTATESASSFKAVNDDIAPLFIHGMYIGGNHGDPGFTKVTCTHDKTEADIGSIWSDGTNQFTIVIVGSEYLVVGNVAGNKVSGVTVGSTLTHVSGASHTTSVTVTEQELFQLNPCGNRRAFSMLNENGKPIASGSNCMRCSAHETYNILDGVAIISYLQSNVGNNTNTSYYINNLTAELAVIDNVYEFNRNGSITMYGGVYFPSAIDFTFYAFSQSIAFSDTQYAFVPDSTNLDQMVLLDTSAQYEVQYSSKLPYRYYQILQDETGGFGIVYNTGLGYGVQEKRSPVCSYPGVYRGNNHKLYPYMLYPDTTVAAKSYFAGVTARMPIRTSWNIKNASWYWIGDDVILTIDIRQGFSGWVGLPKYLAGMKITPLDVSTGVTLGNDFITEYGIYVANNGTGIRHAVLKLTK